MSLKIIIDSFNTSLANVFSQYKNVKVVGLTELVAKKADNKTQFVPGAIINGKIEYAGYEDKEPVLLYNRLTNAAISENTATSYGDSRSDSIMTYNLSMFVYADRNVICLSSSELAELITGNMPEQLIIEGYKNNIVRFGNINFNALQIIKSEYQGIDVKLKPEKIVFQINYQIISTTRRNCVAKCA